MPFVINKSLDIGEENLDVRKVRSSFNLALKSSFPGCTIHNGKFSGSLDGFFEHGVIKADIDLSVKNQKIFIEIKGGSRMSIFAFVLLGLGIFLGAVGKILIGIFMFDLVLFLLGHKLPQKYIEDAIDALKLKIEKSPEKFKVKTAKPSNQKAQSKLPPSLPVAAETV